MAIAELVTGDDFLELFTASKGGAAISIDAAAVVKAAVVNLTRSTVLIAAVTQSKDADGADWANGVIAVSFSTTDTSITTYGQAILEVQISDSIKETFFAAINIVKGNIA